MAETDEPELDLDPPEDDPVEEQDQLDNQDQGEEDQQEVVQTQDQPDRRAGEDRQPSRRDRRIETLTASLAEQRQANADLNRRIDTILAAQHRPQQGETPEARAQRLALLTPEERIHETLQESRVAHAQEMQGLRFQIQDGNDRAAFEAKATVDPLYAKWRTKVDAELVELRSKGLTAEREKIMYYLIGKTAVEGRKGNGGERRQAQQRVDRQRTRPSNSGSDVQDDRRARSNSSLERRLENQSI